MRELGEFASLVVLVDASVDAAPGQVLVRRLGDDEDPLLVSVRSGAPVFTPSESPNGSIGSGRGVNLSSVSPNVSIRSAANVRIPP